MTIFLILFVIPVRLLSSHLFILLACVCVCVCVCVFVCCHSVDSLWSRGLWHTRLLCAWHSPGKNTGRDSHSFLQGDFPNPGIEPKSSALQAFFTV